ncbi:MAG: AAA family ATPase, partial [Candidatus Cloacimonadota bacterium]|nr:AAA family ATPase [Candidatus Cloacimonadota bacterium]
TKDFMSNIKKCYGIENEIQPAFEQLKAMTGLDSVKNAITNIVKGIEKKEKIFEDDYELTPERFKKIKKNSLPYIPHLALLGNPGTGKTTIALLIGKILREEGILESGHLVEVTRGDLVAGYSGQTAIKTNEQIHKALGGVLFIDEAYTLINGEQDSYGRESLGELIKAMDKYEGQFVVIFAGYKNETQTMLTCNPGSARRVKHIELSDYSANELHEIMKARLEQIPMHVSNEIYDNLQTFCANLLSNREQFGGNHFGNAGVVVKQIENALQAARARNARKLLPEHFESPLFFQKLKKGQEDLEELIGLETIKSQLKILFKRNKIESMPPGHYIFSGNPGTGKTIVAQQIANKFYEMNLLKSAKLNKYTASTLIGGHLGSTENKINKILKESLEGVLFIDEAHQLASPHSYGNKVVEAIIPFMEDNRKNFCLICAGYPEKLKNLFKLDPGFKNRFNRTITFEDYSTDELVQIFHKMFSEESYYELENITDQILQTCFKTIKQSEGDFFSNARTVRKFIEELKNCAIENVQSNNSKIYITSQHVEIVKTQWKEHDETD